MVVVPAAFAVANPPPLTPLLIEATPTVEELQCAVVVMSCVVPSENVAVANNCCVWPTLTEGLIGVTTIPVKVMDATVRVVELMIEPRVAVMVTVPNFRLVASPVLSIETTVESDEVQVTSAVRFCVLLSL